MLLDSVSIYKFLSISHNFRAETFVLILVKISTVDWQSMKNRINNFVEEYIFKNIYLSRISLGRFNIVLHECKHYAYATCG